MISEFAPKADKTATYEGCSHVSLERKMPVTA